MASDAIRTSQEIAEIYEKQADTVYRVCFAMLKNTADTEDAVQNTFIRLIRDSTVFKSREHEKAWLIVTAANICRDFLRKKGRFWEPIENAAEELLTFSIDQDSLPLMEAVMALPVSYRIVIYLHYYEGYSTPEISGMLKKPASTIRNHLHRGRKLLKSKLGDDFFAER